MKKTQQERLEKRILNIINNDLKFLEKYIDFRFFSKNLLFFYSFNIYVENDHNQELYSELKKNTILIKNIFRKTKLL